MMKELFDKYSDDDYDIFVNLNLSFIDIFSFYKKL